jgi:signal transduction histidine kinase
MFMRVAAWASLRVAGFPRGDLVLATALGAVAVASVLTGNPDEGPVALTLPVAVVTCAAVAWRTRAPMISVALIVAAGTVQTLAASAPGSLWSLVVYVIVMYSVAAHSREGMAAIAGVVFVAALFVQERIDNGPDYLFIVLLFGGTWLLGRASRLWRSRVSHAEQHQRDLARLAVAEERVRIARELHDSVAHSLSVIAVQSDAAEAALAHDPDRAREPLLAINASARGSLSEIRDMLHLLRDDTGTGYMGAGDTGTDTGAASVGTGDGAHERWPTPGLGALDSLLTTARQAGLAIESRLGEVGDLPAAVDLAAYRIVQEALTNVAKHAGSVSVTLGIRRSRGSLELEVANSPGVPTARPVGSGLGLLGIRERVALLGGTLRAGPTNDGGFRLVACLPVKATSP